MDRPHGIVRADCPHQVPKTLAEAREILRRLPPEQLFLILSNDMHVFKSDVEDLIRQKQIKDPRIKEPTLSLWMETERPPQNLISEISETPADTSMETAPAVEHTPIDTAPTEGHNSVNSAEEDFDDMARTKQKVKGGRGKVGGV